MENQENVEEKNCKTETIKPSVDTYLWQSIAVAVCCFPLLGIAAIVFSAMATSKLSSGNSAGAAENAQVAKLLCKIGFFIGLASYALFILIFGFVMLIQMLAFGVAVCAQNGTLH